MGPTEATLLSPTHHEDHVGKAAIACGRKDGLRTITSRQPAVRHGIIAWSHEGVVGAGGKAQLAACSPPWTRRHIDKAGGHVSVSPALGKERQEHLEFKVIFSYVANLRPA